MRRLQLGDDALLRDRLTQDRVEWQALVLGEELEVRLERGIVNRIGEPRRSCRGGMVPRAGIGVARWAKARARPPAGTCPKGHDVEIVF